MKRATHLVLAFSATITSLNATASDENPATDFCYKYTAQCRASVGVEGFNWEEFSEDGTRFLKEKGARQFIELGYGVWYDIDKEGPYYDVSGKLYGGDIDYSGETVNGTPVNTTTRYSGYSLKATGGYLFSNESFEGMPAFGFTAGLDFDAWNRDIKSTAESVGYVEKYKVASWELGLNLRGPYTDQISTYGKFGIKAPLYTNEKIEAFGLKLTPGKNLSTQGSLGFEYKRLNGSKVNVELYTDNYKFDVSDIKTGNIQEINAEIKGYQPKSEARIYGVKVSYWF